MKNFVRNNYGLIVGAVAGLIIPIPFVNMLIGGIIGGIYDRRPEWLGLDKRKPAVDAWVSKTLDGNAATPSNT